MGSRRASAAAVAVLPTPVGPAMTRRRPAITFSVLPIPPELTSDVLHGNATHDGATVRAEVRRRSDRQVGHEPLHLLAGQRRVGLDGGAAGHERHGAIE